MWGISVNASAVNNYIASHKINHVSITKKVWGGFPHSKYRHGKGKPEGVVVHETGNTSSTIFDEIAYMKKNYRNAFVHSFVDDEHIINIANTDYLCWGVGYPGNARFLQFEQVEMHTKKNFAEEVENAAYYTAYLLKEYQLKPNDACYDGKGTVWSHGSVAKYLGGSDHTDPVGYYKKCGKKILSSIVYDEAVL
ncbi:peptidoglycan recognition protein family protein [Lentilactobacillus kisonensis]|uniref:peptidoglycan recognition protein family protein n=1 Tax=Lentilactobacillus kisonensis TaxID=481722 RepID=UPI000AA8D474|nr:N-acetylmuramoyl-L-alanine amidase [Lentilactobacillus kisonensis]